MIPPSNWNLFKNNNCLNKLNNKYLNIFKINNNYNKNSNKYKVKKKCSKENSLMK